MGNSSSSSKTYTDVKGGKHSTFEAMKKVDEKYVEGKNYTYSHTSSGAKIVPSKELQSHIDHKLGLEKDESDHIARLKEQNRQLGYTETTSDKPKAVKRSRDEDSGVVGEKAGKRGKNADMCYSLGYLAGADSYTGDASSFRDGSAGASLAGASLCRASGEAFEWSKGYSDEKSGLEFGTNRCTDKSECNDFGVCKPK